MWDLDWMFRGFFLLFFKMVAGGVSWAGKDHPSGFKRKQQISDRITGWSYNCMSEMCQQLGAILKMIRQKKEADGSLKWNHWQINLHLTDQPLFVQASQTSNQGGKKMRKLLMTETIKTVAIFTGQRKTHNTRFAGFFVQWSWSR